MPQTVEELLTHFDSGMRRKHALGIIRYVKATADHIRVRTGDDREALFSGTLLTAAIATMFRHKYKEEVWSPDGGILHFDTSANPAAIARDRPLWLGCSDLRRWPRRPRRGYQGRVQP